MKKKAVIVGSCVVVLAAAGYFLFLRGGGHKYDFRFEKVSRGDLTVYVTATGTINAVTSVDVGTQVSGIISKLYADFNSVVKKGQIIAQIDSTFLVQAVNDAKASLDRAQAQFADSKRNLDRTKALFDRGLESQLNYDAALTTYETNKAALKSAGAALERAKINLAYATIYAPIDGVVINRAVNIGQTVAASFSSPTLYTIANDLKKMQVLTTVDESDIGRVSIGQEASFSVDAYPDEKFTGTVSQIRLAPVSIQNVVNYTVVIDFDNVDLKLMPGMTANVKILVANTADALRVPNLALRFQPPPDLIDSTKFQAMRENYFARAETGEDPPGHAGVVDSARQGSPSGGTDGYEHGGQGEGREGRMQRFQKLRDSMVAAHGGNMSREEIMAEMGKLFRSTRRAATQPVAQRTVRAPRQETATYGITQRFPQYEKSSYVPLHESGRGRVWVLNATTGKLEPVFVRTGLNDGRFTEITSNTLKPGDQIVMGASAASEGTGEQARSPFQQGPGGMGGRIR